METAPDNPDTVILCDPIFDIAHSCRKVEDIRSSPDGTAATR